MLQVAHFRPVFLLLLVFVLFCFFFNKPSLFYLCNLMHVFSFEIDILISS